MKLLKFSCAAMFFLPVALLAQPRTIDQRVDSFWKLMTLAEKTGQLNQYSGREVTGPASDKKTNQLTDIKTGWSQVFAEEVGAGDSAI